jgi:hypothetical protein
MDQPTRERSVDSPALTKTDLAVAVATGLVTACVPTQRWSSTARWGLHGGLGALAAGAAALALRSPERFAGPEQRQEPPVDVGPAAGAAIALAFGAFVAGLSRGGEAADGWMERTLAARGVRRPRAWMGLVAAGASLAMSVADHRRTPPGGRDGTLDVEGSGA